MRQWASEQQCSNSQGTKTRLTGAKLCQRLDVNSNDPSPLKPTKGSRYLCDGDDSPPKRLSRHIPQREGMDMPMATFNLIGSASVTNSFTMVNTNGRQTVNHTNVPSSSRTTTATSSMATSFSESHVSDDSFYATSMYNDLLADKLASRTNSTTTVTHGDKQGDVENYSASGHRRRTFGGEILRFNSDCKGSSSSDTRHSSITSLSSQVLDRQRLFSSPHARTTSFSRTLCTNPEKVLDAPEFPTTASQLLHWGTNNKLIIGLKNALYAWDAESGDASKLVEMREGYSIRCLQWLHKCNCVALSVDSGTTAIYDCRSEDFIRSVRLPAGMEVTGLGVHGPLMAAASDHGVVKVFDLRAKSAEVQSFSGHRGSVATLHYCGVEPFYLATGGEDGNVRVWDARHNNPRYTFDSVYSGPVTALHWDPSKRSRLFSGGGDGILCHIDTHAATSGLGEDHFSQVDDMDSVSSLTLKGTDTRHFISRAIRTNYPITGIVSNANSEEVATTHREKGQIQLRRISNLHLMGTFNSPNCDADLTCPTLSPDHERVCAAQGDETLKFWKVFRNTKTNSTRGSLSHHHDPMNAFDEPLR
ncbi:cell division cycle 20, cofactor of APC complex [Angomonas deanei]|nr:cell division cycle 20, cofactor of APC complex [Angomonas deanei]|eukprot:EPY27419.1 cell division cycle 20, cofactor of APC complex [Angomonas deanei]